MGRLDDFRAYGELAPPAPIRGTTDPEVTSVAVDTVRDFMVPLRHSVFLGDPRFDHDFNELWLQTSRGPGYPMDSTELMTIRFRDIQTLVAVFDERDPFNNHAISILKFPLHDMTKRAIMAARPNLFPAYRKEVFGSEAAVDDRPLQLKP